jgi:hypothetical protein
MKLFRPVRRGFQDCVNILSDLNRLVDWCGANSLELNVGKCKSITSSILRHPVEFPYMLRGIFFDHVDSITDLGVVMDRRMSLSRPIDFMVGKALAILGFVKRLAGDIRDPYILRTLYVSLVRSKLEYASCVRRDFNEMHINRIERVQRKFVRYALRGLEWTDVYDLPGVL